MSVSCRFSREFLNILPRICLSTLPLPLTAQLLCTSEVCTSSDNTGSFWKEAIQWSYFNVFLRQNIFKCVYWLLNVTINDISVIITWWHIDVQADWRRSNWSLTYSPAPKIISYSIIVCREILLSVAITRGPKAFYRSPDNQQQTVQSDKKTTRMTGFK